MLIGSGVGFLLWLAFAVYTLISCKGWEQPNYAALVVFFLMSVGCGFYGGALVVFFVAGIWL